jgi:ribosomal protein S18 acetylase RimI-like enzyme
MYTLDAGFSAVDEPGLRALIRRIGWSDRQIQGQVLAAKELASSPNGCVILARRGDEVIGYVAVQFHEWNRLGQIHGLVVDPDSRRQSIATRLVARAEAFVREKDARGIYVDTPVDNTGGRRFYEALGYLEAYIMPEYYDAGQDGITYSRFFR